MLFKGEYMVSNPLSEENKFEKLKESCDDILIMGPSGAGKGFLAKLLHTQSNKRAGKNFIHINSASINSSIFESEMFGHIKGSFTGAIYDKEGYCAKVKDGDLFLDEIGDLSMDLQTKLLVLISDRIYIPVGSSQMQTFNGRIIAATNKDLKKEVINGKFREDLYYRLSNFVLNVKALCEQKEIIPHLLKKFLEEENCRITFTKSAIQYFSEQKYNGNIRQLKSIVKRIIRYEDDKKSITLEDIIPYIEEEMFSPYQNSENFEDKDLSALIKAIHYKINGKLPVLTKLFIENALSLSNGNITAAARNIGIGRKSLERMLKKYEIKKNCFSCR